MELNDVEKYPAKNYQESSKLQPNIQMKLKGEMA